MADQPALLVQGASKRYPGVQALLNMDFDVLPGEIHAVVGENGSGKSTMLGIVAGVVMPDTGTVELLGERLPAWDPGEARRRGLATIYQDNSLVLQFTVAQNLYLSAREEDLPPYRERYPWAARLLERYGVPMEPTAFVGSLSEALRQYLEIIKALIRRPQVLQMDEPTTALDPRDVEHLHGLIREVAKQGTAVVYVSHRLREVLELCNRVTVLRDGESQGTYDPQEMVEEDIVALMVGRPVALEYPPKDTLQEDAEPILRLRQLRSERFGPIDFEVRPGEILGLAGAEGNGQRELVRALAGFEVATGRVEVEGQRVRLNSAQRSLRGGIMVLSGDRRESVFPPLGVRHNMTVQVLNQYSRFGFMQAGKERRAAQALRDELEIVTPSLEQPLQYLSGGNQQKTVLARPFLFPARVLVVDEPTQGVDAKARLDIYRALRRKAREGVGIIIKSSDALELGGMCDRVLVMSRGRIVTELTGQEQMTETAIVGAFLTATGLESVEGEGDGEAQRIGSRLEGAGAIDAAAYRKRGRRLRAFLRTDWAPPVLLLAIILGIGFYANSESDAFLTAFNMKSLLFTVTAIALVGMAQLHVMAVGGFDISVGSQMSIAVVVASYTMVRGDPLIVVALGGLGVLGVGLLIGTINGTLVRRIGINVVIATIAMLALLQGVALLLRRVVGGPISDNFANALRADLEGAVPYAFMGIVALAIVLDIWLHGSGRGLRARAMGFREVAAYRVGVRTNFIFLRAFLITALMTAIAGIFLAAQVRIGDPTVGVQFGFKSFGAAVLGGATLTGGRGTFVGTLLGAIVLQETVNIIPLVQIHTAIGFIITGALTLAAILMYSRSDAWGRFIAKLRARRRRMIAAGDGAAAGGGD